MTLDEAIQHCKEKVQEQAKKGCYRCAEKHQQLAEWLKELKAYKDARAEIAEAFNDDVWNDQNDYERGRKSGIFLCESIISVKLGESRLEIPNTCCDAISRADARHLIAETNRNSLGYISTKVFKILYDGVDNLPSVTPKPKMGLWKIHRDSTGKKYGECSECMMRQSVGPLNYCPNCGAKMECENAT